MELILKEWLGADGKWVSLSDDEVKDLNFDFYNKKDGKILPNILKSAGYNVNVKDKEPIGVGRFYEVFEENIALKLDNNKDLFVSSIREVNARHFKDLGKESSGANPIIDVFDDNGKLMIKTYQYAAEFEIKLNKKDTLKIRIEPRNLVSNEYFEKMLQSVFNFHTLSEISGGESNSFVVMYYIAFLNRLKNVLAKGIYREYIELEDNLPYLRERLLVADHLRINMARKDKLYCGFSELSSDNIINRTIHVTLQSIVRKLRNYSPICNKARSIDTMFVQDGIEANRINLNDISSIRYNRMNQHYKEIMDYCYIILRNLGGSFSPNDDLKYSAFYVDMNELFETFVGKKLQEKDSLYESIWNEISENTDDYIVEFQNINRYYLDEEQVFAIRPDFLVKDSERKVIAVIDTKYKRLFNDKSKHYGIHREDVYQVVTYAYKFDTDKIFLVYPKPPQNNPPEDLVFEINGKTLYIRFVDLISTPENSSIL